MKISQQELDRIVKEEIEAAVEEGFLDNIKSMGSRAGSKVAGAFGADTASREMGAKADALRDKSAAEKAKKKGRRRRKKADSAARSSGQTYPATELTALSATLRNVASKSGVPFPGSRGNMVKAFEKVLRSGGYALDEAKDEKVFIGQKGNIQISARVAPDLVKWLGNVKNKAPDIFARVVQELANYRFDVPAELAAAEVTASEEDEPANRITSVNQNNLATRDADNYGDDDKLNDKGLKLATAQAAFLKKKGKEIPAILATAIKDASGGGEDQTATIKTKPVTVSGKRVPLEIINKFAKTANLDKETSRKVVKVVRDAGYTLSEIEIKRLKRTAGIK
jgi:hypothetical protein